MEFPLLFFSSFFLFLFFWVWKRIVAQALVKSSIDERNNPTDVQIALLESNTAESGKSTGIQVYLNIGFDKQFTANLMKSITGSTSLIFPYTMWKVDYADFWNELQMGIVTGGFLTLYILYVYITSAWKLLQVYKHFQQETKVCICFKYFHFQDESDSVYKLDNDYTVLCYHYFGKGGYWLMLLSTLITLWGSDMGTMVLMTDLLVSLPWFNSFSESETTRRIVATIILFVLCWLTCIFKNPTFVLCH